MIENYIGVLKKYAVFSGRARRREFWLFFLCNIIISIVLTVLGLIPGIGMVFGVLSILYSLAIFIPTLALGARRLHDTDKTGWLQLLMLIPLVGVIILIVFWATAGESKENEYGPNPKG